MPLHSEPISFMQNYDVGKITKQHKIEEHERDLKLNITIVWTRALIFLFPDFSVGRRTCGFNNKKRVAFSGVYKEVCLKFSYWIE